MGILFQRRHLGDCLLLIKNGANIKQDKGTGGIPITRIETLSGGVFNRDRLGYAGIDQPGKYESFILESGDLLFSHINSKAYIGRTVLYQKEGSEVIIHGMNLLRIKVIPELLIPKYLYYTTLTDGFKSQVASSRKDAVNQSSISVSDIKRIIIPVPSLIEQQRIVDELDLLTGIIDKKNAQLRDLDALAQSIFYEMFGDPAVNEKGWPVKQISELFDVGSSKRVFESEWRDSGVPFYRAREIVRLSKGLPLEDPIFIEESLFAAYKEKYGIPAAGDIMVTGVGTLGICYLVKEGDRFYFKDGNTLWFKDKHVSNSRFIKDQFLTEYVKDQIMGNSHGATVGTYTIVNAKKTRVICPPVKLQNEYEERVNAIDSQKRVIGKSLTETQNLLDSRMHNYFG